MCLYPITAYSDGVHNVQFTRHGLYSDIVKPVQLKCGRCVECEQERASVWTARVLDEMKDYEDTTYITLTYNEESCPSDGQLVRSDVQKFIKRLRKKISPKKIKIFYCGEYGEERNRPHYHIIVLGYDFNDKYPWKLRDGHWIYRSNELETLWTQGFSVCGEVNEFSIRYCVKYLQKQQFGRDKDEKERNPSIIMPFVGMSQGIGGNVADKLTESNVVNDSIYRNGKRYRLPRYYIDRAEKNGIVSVEDLRSKRKRNMIANIESEEDLDFRRERLKKRMRLLH